MINNYFFIQNLSGKNRKKYDYKKITHFRFVYFCKMFEYIIQNTLKNNFSFVLGAILLLVLPVSLHAQKNKLTGTIEGRITAPIKNDVNNSTAITTIGLAGIEVNLRYKNGGVYYNLGSVYTDENGGYSISYSKAQKKGNKSKLFLRALAKTNSSYNVRSKNSGRVYKYDYLIGNYGDNTGVITNKDIHIIDASKGDAFRSVHWVRKGIKYFREQSVPIKGGLTIKVNKRGSYSNNYLYCKNPVIHVRKKSGIHENTVFHEFGHYAMYRLQNNHIKIPLGERGVNNHRKRDENTGLLAWIEGWAVAIQMIIDAAHWQEDNELGLDAYGYTYENVRKFETIKNGIRSEYHIATAIYDLWDGPGKNLPERTPCLNIHGWDDSEIRNVSSHAYYAWKSIDDVELTFAQICAPLQTVKTHKEMKQLRNVGHYYNILLSQLPECKDKADVSRVFLENRVVWNIKDYEDALYMGNLSSDPFFTTINKKERGFLRMEFPLWFSKWTDSYHVNIPLRDGEKKHYLYALPNTSFALTDHYWIGIYDMDKGIQERMEFYLNPYANAEKTNLPHGDFYTCGGNQILVRNGYLELGMLNSDYTADLTISDGSLLKIEEHGTLILNHNTVLRIATGGALHVKKTSSVILRGNASIVAEDGASVFVEDGGELSISKPSY